MAKFIKDETYNALIAARDNWNAVAGHVANCAEENAGITTESVTPQMVIDALDASDDTNQSEELATALERVTTLETENTALQEQVNNLRSSGGEQEAVINADGEPSASDADLASFVEANKGDYAALNARMKKEGLLNK